jgi:hypothetical protein
MRLISRLFVLLTLLTLLLFPNLLSANSLAESGTCSDNCDRIDAICTYNCGSDQTCQANCADSYGKCLAKCSAFYVDP